MNERLTIIEDRVAQCRAALIVNGDVRRLWFGPSNDDPNFAALPTEGKRFVGRVRKVDKTIGAAFIDIGIGDDGFLNLTDASAAVVNEGSFTILEVVAPARQSKGPTLRFIGLEEKSRAIGPVNVETSAVSAARILQAGDAALLTDSVKVQSALSNVGFNAEVWTKNQSLFSHYGVDSICEDVFSKHAPIAGGGALIIDEAHALIAIDVDTGGLPASSAPRLREKIALAGAYEAARQIMLRNLSGRIVIDFPSIDARSRRRCATAVIEAMNAVDRVGSISWSGRGLLQMTRRRFGPSLLEMATEPGDETPTPGRRYTLDWEARRLLVEAENRLRNRPGGRLFIRAGSLLAEYIASKLWMDTLNEKYPARILLEASSEMKDRDSDITEQR